MSDGMFSDEQKNTISQKMKSRYIEILEVFIHKNHLSFVVFDNYFQIQFQNIALNKQLKNITDLAYFINETTLNKIRQIFEVSTFDSFETSFRDGLQEITLFTLPHMQNYFFLQIKAVQEGLTAPDTIEPVKVFDEQKNSVDDDENEMLNVQNIQFLLLELRKLEASINTEESLNKINDYFIPELNNCRQKIQDPLILLCLDIISQNLNELVDSSGAISNLYKVLTPSEVKVADFIRKGMSSKDIAHCLDITQKTVENHRNNLRNKLGLKNRGINLQTFLMNGGHAAAVSDEIPVFTKIPVKRLSTE